MINIFLSGMMLVMAMFYIYLATHFKDREFPSHFIILAHIWIVGFLIMSRLGE
jgi:hypothetical protein